MWDFLERDCTCLTGNLSQAQVCQEEGTGEKILPGFQYLDYVAMFSLLEFFPPGFYSLCCPFPACAPLLWAW